MLIQVYNDGDQPRIFIEPGCFEIMAPYVCRNDGSFDKESLETTDTALHLLRLYRKEKWEKTSWGYQAKLRWKQKRRS